MSTEHLKMHRPRQSDRIRGFTLVELLLALTVLLILAGLTIRLLNQTMQSDRIRTGARELQSFFAGARDRAIYAGQPVGVRLLTDPANPSTVRSFVYIGASASFTDGTQIQISSVDNRTISMVNSTTGLPLPGVPPTTWTALMARGMLFNGAQITLGGAIYSMAQNGADGVLAGAWALTKNFAGTTNSSLTYSIQLGPSILSGDEPRAFPQGIAIDLNNSVLPSNWGSPGAYSSQLDVLFSPGGVVTGPVASAGRIHFVLSELADAAGQALTPNLAANSAARYRLDAPWQANTAYQLSSVVVPTPSTLLAMRVISVTGGGVSGGGPPAWPTQPNQTVVDNQLTWQSFAKKPNLIVSLATDTGRVTTHPVDLSDALTTDPAAPPNSTDTFRFAEIGEVTQ
jgi:prepilin-type N-terminal cleavage/methylation domain-containing protein